MNLALLGGFSEFCSETSGILKIVGIVVSIFKFVIPLLIIIYGMIDLGKAVVASKDDEIKKAAKSIGFRLAAGILIFFIPTIVMMIFGWVNSYNELMDESEFQVCQDCILHPRGGNCEGKGITD